MGAVMIRCPQTGRAIPTGLEMSADDFARTPVFFARTRCPICQSDHEWFAPQAWVCDSPGSRPGMTKHARTADHARRERVRAV
jgi:hypothetical protein